MKKSKFSKKQSVIRYEYESPEYQNSHVNANSLAHAVEGKESTNLMSYRRKQITKAGRFAPPQIKGLTHEAEDWREDFFRAICTDNLEVVRTMIEQWKLNPSIYQRERDTLIVEKDNEFNIDALIFGVFLDYKVSQSNNQRESKSSHESKRDEDDLIFLAYGAHQSGSRPIDYYDEPEQNPNPFYNNNNTLMKTFPIKFAATAQHVAVWKNAYKVASYLSSIGASTSIADACSTSVYDRASTRKMQSILRRPSRPTNLIILNYGEGKAVIQFNMVECTPKVISYEIKEQISGASWVADANHPSIKIFSRSGKREDEKTVLFEIPKGAVSSNRKHHFMVRARNIDNFLSEWCLLPDSKTAPHWINEWSREEKERDDMLARREIEDGDNLVVYRALRVGCVTFGEVPASEWYVHAVRKQHQMALKMQAFVRGYLSRLTVNNLLKEKDLELRRHIAASDIQRVYRAYMERKLFGHRQLSRMDMDSKTLRGYRGKRLKSRKPKKASAKASIKLFVEKNVSKKDRANRARFPSSRFDTRLPTAWKC